MDFGGWELMLLLLALLIVGSAVYGFVWTVKRFTR
jgi:predicted neutral ceramidase superfamily lipid hydrolase